MAAVTRWAEEDLCIQCVRDPQMKFSSVFFVLELQLVLSCIFCAYSSFFLLVVVVVVVVINILIYYKPCDRWFPRELESTNEPLLTHPRDIHLSKNPFHKKILGIQTTNPNIPKPPIYRKNHFLAGLFEDGTTCQPWAGAFRDSIYHICTNETCRWTP